MRRITVAVGPLAAASANNICLSQTPTTGKLTLNGSLVTGGVAVLDTPRRVLLTTTADESSLTFTFVGVDANGSTVTEVLAGVNNTTAYTKTDYKSVSSITISGNAAGALTVGTNGVASSAWVSLDDWATPLTTIQGTVTGTVNYTVQITNDNPNSPTSPVSPASVVWFSAPDLNLQAQTVSAIGSLNYSPAFARVLLNSSVSTGAVSASFIQSGSVGY